MLDDDNFREKKTESNEVQTQSIRKQSKESNKKQRFLRMR